MGKLVTSLDDDGLTVASNEEKEVLQKIRAVFRSEEWVDVIGFKAHDRRRVKR